VFNSTAVRRDLSSVVAFTLYNEMTGLKTIIIFIIINNNNIIIINIKGFSSWFPRV
jgi:hypothetical protein